MKYRCKTCRTSYGNRYTAIYCCNVSNEVTRYICSECDEVYPNRNSADMCCEDMMVEEMEE